MKILYVTTISLTINSFFKPHIEMLIREGHQVDIACNCREMEPDELYSELGCNVHQIDFSRSPLSLANVRAYRQLKRAVADGGYDIVHCHTPNASVITRLVCRRLRRKNNLKVFYTAHGFHFYKGSPKINWMVYYPIEKFCSRFTDKLITINQEDYALAKAKFKAGAVYYVPGVGIDLSKFEGITVDKSAKRSEIGVPEDATLLFSVGELNENKNHQLVIRAMARLNMPKLHYAIAGVGDQRDALLALAKELGVDQQVHLLGYRRDIAELNHIADIFCFPSYREGLSVSLMETMAMGLPCMVSRIRGNTDLVDHEGGALFDPHSIDACCDALAQMLNTDTTGMRAHNRKRICDFSLPSVLSAVDSLYQS